MDISELINKNLVDLKLEGETQEEVITALANLLAAEDKITSRPQFKQAVLQREEEGTTGFGQGVAIPHCKSSAVQEISIAVGKLKQPVDWDAMDDNPVRFVIMLAIPADKANKAHIQILSKISGRLMEDEFVERLLAVNSPKELIKLLSEDQKAS